MQTETINRDRSHAKAVRTKQFLKYAALVLALCACGTRAYFLMFSHFGFWDDEGYLMETVRSMLQGHRVYDEIYTLYGPFYYLFEWVLYAVTRVPVTHDFGRFVALFFWLLTAILAAGFVLRLTSSFSLTGLTLLLVSKVLVFFSGEPGHPEELCIVCICFLLAVTCTVKGRLTDWQSTLLGFLLSALAFTKINIGLYTILAVLLTLMITQPAPRLKKFAFGVVALGSFCCIALIMSPLLSLDWARNYFLLVILSLMASLLAAYRTRPATVIAVRSWYLLAAIFAATGLATVLPFLLHGTTMSAMLYISVLQHKNFAREWFVSAPFNVKSILWAAFSLVLSAVWFSRRPALLQGKTFEVGLQCLKGVVALLSTVYFIIGHTDMVYGVALLKFIVPVSWLVMTPPAKPGNDDDSFARVFLCFLAIFVALYPFPVASAQLLFALVPLIVVIAVFWHDAFTFVALHIPEATWGKAQRLLPAAASVLLIWAYAAALYKAVVNYSVLVPLALPGATHIRVMPSTANTYRWITEKLNRECTSFFSMPGLFSFDFWTGKGTPTMMMMNDWTGFLNADQQQVIVNDLIRNHTNCIVYYPELVAMFQRGRDMSQSPVAQYIHGHFRETAERNGYHFLIHTDKPSAESQ
jgi:hypothetical protein